MEYILMVIVTAHQVAAPRCGAPHRPKSAATGRRRAEGAGAGPGQMGAGAGALRLGERRWN